MSRRNFASEAPSDPHSVLGVSRDASEDEIRAAWKKTALRTHPDRTGDDGTQFRRAKAAYESLLPSASADARFSYDYSRRRTPSQRRRRADKPAACKAAEKARAAEDRVRARAAEVRETEEAYARMRRQRYAAERAANERRMQAETLRAYEERLQRQRQHAYREELREKAEQLAKERETAAAARPATWADKHQARHAGRFAARCEQYLAKKREAEQKQEGQQEVQEEEAPPPPSPKQQQQQEQPSLQQPGSADGEAEQPTGAVRSTERGLFHFGGLW